MTDFQIKICFPTPGTKIQHPDGKGAEFWAFGTAHDARNLVGVLVNCKTRKYYIGKLVPANPKFPRRWVLLFQVPDPTGDDYRLEVYHQFSPLPNCIEAHVEPINLVSPTRGLTITYPANGGPGGPSQCCSTPFCAQGGFTGTTYSINMATTNLQGNGNTYYPDPNSLQIAGTSWYIEWSTVPDCNNYTLTVIGIPAPARAQAAYLDIEAQYC